MTTLTREQAAQRFAELPMPSTKDEHWRYSSARDYAGRPGPVPVRTHWS